jgi:hypothetical protein
VLHVPHREPYTAISINWLENAKIDPTSIVLLLRKMEIVEDILEKEKITEVLFVQ